MRLSALSFTRPTKPATETTMSGDMFVQVRRHWIATYRLCDIEGWHWSDVSGGVNARAP